MATTSLTLDDELEARIEKLAEERGRHITGDELFAWLRTWGTEDDKGPPKRHT